MASPLSWAAKARTAAAQPTTAGARLAVTTSRTCCAETVASDASQNTAALLTHPSKRPAPCACWAARSATASSAALLHRAQPRTSRVSVYPLHRCRLELQGDDVTTGGHQTLDDSATHTTAAPVTTKEPSA
jgi:hypothetical protein